MVFGVFNIFIYIWVNSQIHVFLSRFVFCWWAWLVGQAHVLAVLWAWSIGHVHIIVYAFGFLFFIFVVNLFSKSFRYLGIILVYHILLFLVFLFSMLRRCFCFWF